MALTKKGWTWIFALIVFVVIGIILYVYRDKIFKKKGAICDPNRPGYDLTGNLNDKCNVKIPTTPPSSGGSWIPESFPLKQKMYGIKIKVLQQALGINDDGEFGPKTETAVTDAGYSVPLSEVDYNAIIKPGIGSDAYANADGVKVYNKDGSIFATKSKDAWVGKVTGRKGAYTDKWIQAYIVSGDKFVDENDVYLR